MDRQPDFSRNSAVDKQACIPIEDSVWQWHHRRDRSSTLTFDTEALRRTHIGEWLRPFQVRAYYDRELDAAATSRRSPPDTRPCRPGSSARTCHSARDPTAGRSRTTRVHVVAGRSRSFPARTPRRLLTLFRVWYSQFSLKILLTSKYQHLCTILKEQTKQYRSLFLSNKR